MEQVVIAPSEGTTELGGRGTDGSRSERSVRTPSESPSDKAGLLNPPPSDNAKRYQLLKLTISLTETIAIGLLLFVAVALGWTHIVSSWAYGLVSNKLAAFLVFIAILGVFETALTLPVNWYSAFYLEHKFRLSNQTLLRWAGEKLKAAALVGVISVPILILLFLCLKHFDTSWWLPVGVVVFVVSVVLARIAPTIIFPIFYKFTPLEDGSLKERLLALCRKEGLYVHGVFTFNMSKNTKKANAGFAGIGKSRRIILADTLLNNFAEDEIVTVFAHELGHYRYRHIRKGISIGAITTFAGLFLTAQLYTMSLSWFGFESLTDLAALPLLGLWLGLYGMVTTPLNNMLSRFFERQADHFALERTPDKNVFISTMKKLASMNLSDPSPHPVVEFLLYSHPSIDKRIRMASEA